MEFFKIQSKGGLFSTGGTSPFWSRNGKQWSKECHLRRHLTELTDSHRNFYDDATIVTYKFEPYVIHTDTATDYMLDLQKLKDRRIQERIERRKRVIEAEELAEYTRLRSKFESLHGDPGDR